MINIDQNHLLTIKNILQQFIPNPTVWVFGSRIKQTAKSYSDLDLVIIGDKPISQKIYYQIQDAMEESDIPFRVEVLDWHRISPAFREAIQQQYEVLDFS